MFQIIKQVPNIATVSLEPKTRFDILSLLRRNNFIQVMQVILLICILKSAMCKAFGPSLFCKLEYCFPLLFLLTLWALKMDI